MQRDMLILACHAVDGHFADGNRSAVRQVLDQSHYIMALTPLGPERFILVCADGGEVELQKSRQSSLPTFEFPAA